MGCLLGPKMGPGGAYKIMLDPLGANLGLILAKFAHLGLNLALRGPKKSPKGAQLGANFGPC